MDLDLDPPRLDRPSPATGDLAVRENHTAGQPAVAPGGLRDGRTRVTEEPRLRVAHKQLVVDLQQVHAPRTRRTSRLPGTRPEREALDRLAPHLVAEVVERPADVGDREARPPSQVPFSCRAVALQIPASELDEGVLPVERAIVGRDSIIEERERLLFTAEATAADHRLQLTMQEDVRQALAGRVDPRSGEDRPDL